MHTTHPIKLTNNAIRKVYKLIEEEGNPNLKFRIFITGGGCSGFQYGFSFEEKTNPDDVVIKQEIKEEIKTADEAGGNGEGSSQLIPGVEVIVDAFSLPYLEEGVEVDYTQDIKGEYFVVRNNAKAKTTCGCGSSFSVD